MVSYNVLAINHVSFATASVLALSVYTNQPFFLPFLVFVVFSALLPDIDHKNSEVSQLIPAIHKLFGHRMFTHSILGMCSFFFIVYMVFKPSVYITYALLFAVFVGIYYWRKVLIKRSRQVDRITADFFSEKQLLLFINISSVILVLMAGIASLTVWQQQARDEVFLLLIFGYISHIIGDFVTKSGVPLFWPNRTFFGLKLFRTGGTFERFLGVVLMIANIYYGYLFWEKYQLSHAEYWARYITLNL